MSPRFNRATVLECGCGQPMFPNISTGDEEGYGWICTNISCGDYTAPELSPEDLEAVGVPAWVADRLVELIESLTEV